MNQFPPAPEYPIRTVSNLPPVSTTPAANFATSFASAVDTGGKFATSVNDTCATIPVVHFELQISSRISKKFETALIVYWGAWGKLIHEKKARGWKSRDTVPLAGRKDNYKSRLLRWGSKLREQLHDVLPGAQPAARLRAGSDRRQRLPRVQKRIPGCGQTVPRHPRRSGFHHSGSWAVRPCHRGWPSGMYVDRD